MKMFLVYLNLRFNIFLSIMDSLLKRIWECSRSIGPEKCFSAEKCFVDSTSKLQEHKGLII